MNPSIRNTIAGASVLGEFGASYAQIIAAFAPLDSIAPVETAPRALDDRLWSILAKPLSEETEADREYLAAIERDGARTNGGNHE